MAQQSIAYKGQTARPDDYSSKDGDLALSLNLISEDGALHPLHEPQTLFTLPEGCRVVFVHATATYKHYIVANTSGQLYWIAGDTTGTVSQLNNQIGTISGAKSVTAVGNTLVVLTDTAMHYVLWKNNGYTYLGTHLPELDLSFGLQGEALFSSTSELVFTDDEINSTSISVSTDGKSHIFVDQNQNVPKKINEAVLATINKFIADKSVNDGRFIFPFFVRYAFRLYDGTLTMQSAPVLMITSSGLAPWVYLDIQGDTPISFVHFYSKVAAVVCDLDYACVDETQKELLETWSDIIKSVDIFVSAPIYTYNQAGKIEGWAYNYPSTDPTDIDATVLGYTISKATPQWVPSTPPVYEKRDVAPLFTLSGSICYYLLPRHSSDTVASSVADCANFYLLKSFNIEDLATTRTKIDIPKDYLQSLTSRERLPDDYDSHDTLQPNYSFVNNSRLMLADMNKLLAEPSAAAACVPYVEGNNHTVDMYVHVMQDGREIVIESRSSVLGNGGVYPYLYYPNANATKIEIETQGQGELTPVNYYSLQLKRHSMLNGSYFFNDWIPAPSRINAIDTTTTDRTVRLPNKLYVSSVDNPFYFPVSGISTVGTGTIQALATVNEPVSQGQFGHSDIYIFTTDGLWVAKIMADGNLESINPVSQDVCTNPAAVVQLAKTVLFPTQRGIMAVAGSRIEPLTDTIDTDNPFNLAALPHLTDPNVLPAALGTPALPAFQQFINGCKMLFDYQHQRVVVFNPAIDQAHRDTPLYPYAYVYSLRSKQWGMMQSGLTDTFNAYPDAMAMSGNAVVSLNTDITFENQLTVTRPFKLGLPDVLKTIRAMIQRGMFSRGHVKCILYGSRDLVHWYVVGSSMSEAIRRMSGSGYKYFRVAVLSTLAASETLTGATVEAVPKHTNAFI